VGETHLSRRPARDGASESSGPLRSTAITRLAPALPIACLLPAALVAFASVTPGRLAQTGQTGATAVAQVPQPAARQQRDIRVLTIDGVINPLTERYLERGLRDAADAGAQLVVLRLDTPGGLESSMRAMAQAIMASRIPVAVYVDPPGARAASAGMFLTIAASVAAMAPGTNIGAAHPVGLGGGQADSVMTGKVVNDAAAFARSLAEERGRNGIWTEAAVRRSVSLTASEALQQNVIDIVARDLGDLLQQLDGRQVAAATETVTLHTEGAEIVDQPMKLGERLLHVITDPNIAYVLFTLAMVGLVAELYHPGLIFPGVTGAVSLLLALVAFGSLPINWAGVLLMIISVALVIAELHTQGGGVLGVGAIITFVLGSLLLYQPMGVPSPAAPAVRVSPWLVAALTTAMAAFFGLVIRSLVRAQRAPVLTGTQALLGRIGIAATDLVPTGQVRVDSEVWSAIAAYDTVRAGDEVEVIDVEGVTLIVRRLPT
jgi:membrane-bound serine protease (ClpP class)